MTMIDRQERMAALLAMSRTLGHPAADCAMMGEGNTSTRASEDTFWVKASGFQLPCIEEAGFTECCFETVLELLEADDISDENVKRVLAAAQVNPEAPRPSVETILHALLLRLPGIEFVGHTHPTAVNSILCAKNGQEAFAGRLFPDEIVCCGPKYVWIPFTDPGAPLARAVNQAVRQFVEENQMPPKVILMQNHGCIGLGPTRATVENATMMLVKTARVILGTYALGGPNVMPEEVVDRIYSRPDEKYREALLEAIKKG
jgi:rhamnose utilization protein RhaD (predicted bifunctional aldolase and dehydrogenase)